MSWPLFAESHWAQESESRREDERAGEGEYLSEKVTVENPEYGQADDAQDGQDDA